MQRSGEDAQLCSGKKERLRKEDCLEFEISQNYIENSRPAWAIEFNPGSKQQEI